MHFNYLTLYPKMFPGFLGYSLMGKALEKGLWSYDTINIRDFATDNYKTDKLFRNMGEGRNK